MSIDAEWVACAAAVVSAISALYSTKCLNDFEKQRIIERDKETRPNFHFDNTNCRLIHVKIMDGRCLDIISVDWIPVYNSEYVSVSKKELSFDERVKNKCDFQIEIDLKEQSLKNKDDIKGYIELRYHNIYGKEEKSKMYANLISSLKCASDYDAENPLGYFTNE